MPPLLGSANLRGTPFKLEVFITASVAAMSTDCSVAFSTLVPLQPELLEINAAALVRFVNCCSPSASSANIPLDFYRLKLFSTVTKAFHLLEHGFKPEIGDQQEFILFYFASACLF